MRRHCRGALLQADAAKKQWAYTTKESNGATPNLSDLVGAGGYMARPPVCPASGAILLNPVGTDPSCRVHGSLRDLTRPLTRMIPVQ